jgi:hypothetical protein
MNWKEEIEFEDEEYKAQGMDRRLRQHGLAMHKKSIEMQEPMKLESLKIKKGELL